MASIKERKIYIKFSGDLEKTSSKFYEMLKEAFSYEAMI
jgi:hypothetical protein